MLYPSPITLKPRLLAAVPSCWSWVRIASKLSNFTDAERAGEMNCIECSDYSRKGFSGALENFVIHRTNGQRLVNDLNLPHESRYFRVGDLVSQAHTIYGSQRFNSPQSAAVRFVPFPPDGNRIGLAKKNPKDHGGVEINNHRRRRSSKSVFTAEDERFSRMPLTNARSLTGRRGA